VRSVPGVTRHTPEIGGGSGPGHRHPGSGTPRPRAPRPGTAAGRRPTGRPSGLPRTCPFGETAASAARAGPAADSLWTTC